MRLLLSTESDSILKNILSQRNMWLLYCLKSIHFQIIYRVHRNYGNQGLMESYRFNSLSAINLTRGYICSLICIFYISWLN